MTRTEFFTLFGGVAAPDYRGAPYPDFAPDKINTRMFLDELRPKSYEVNFTEGRNGKPDTITIRWVSQGWANVDTLVREIRRCMVHIGFVGEVKMLFCQRSYGVYTDHGKRRRFVLK